MNNETVNIECLKHLPSQLDELVSVIEKMLLADFESIIATEFERDMDLIKLSELGNDIVNKMEFGSSFKYFLLGLLNTEF